MLATIPSPSSSGFHLGPVEIHLYGLMYVVALGAGILIAVRRWEAQGGSRQLVYDVALWAFPAGLIGGRLYFDMTSANLVSPHWWGPLAIWDGGLGIWGGIAAGSAVGLWRLRRAGVVAGPFMDAVAPALLVGQALGRIGNYFNQELFGSPTSLPWALHISAAHRPDGYASFATFQPTFLYELVWNLGLAGFLVWLGHHRRIRPPGLFALYVAGYSAFRIFEESLRVDPAHHILGLRLNIYVAIALTVAGSIWFVVSQRSGDRRPAASARPPTVLALGGAVLALAGCGGSWSATGIAEREAARQDQIIAERTPSPTASAPDLASRQEPAPRTTPPRPAHQTQSRPAPSREPELEAQKSVPPPADSPSSIPPASAGTNGSYAPPPGAARKKITPGNITALVRREEDGLAISVNGIALAPPQAPERIKAAITAANAIVGQPYVWGGGHQSFSSRGYDCSGAVSFALGGGGFLSAPLASGQLESWGEPGPGRWLTVFASATHAYLVVAGLRFDTVGDARGSGPRWHPLPASSEGFVARHAPGY